MTTSYERSLKWRKANPEKFLEHCKKYRKRHENKVKLSIKRWRESNKGYRSWQAMIARCNDPRQRSYKNYGGRGIKVCDRWLHSFVNFREDMGLRPQGMTLDRVNSNGNYEPGNCRWATWTEQRLNRRKK